MAAFKLGKMAALLITEKKKAEKILYENKTNVRLPWQLHMSSGSDIYFCPHFASAAMIFGQHGIGPSVDADFNGFLLINNEEPLDRVNGES